MKNILNKLKFYAKRNTLLFVVLSISLISVIIIPPDKQYFSYFDYRTLSTLLFMLIIVSGLSISNFFQYLSSKIISRFNNMRILIFILILITFLGSIIIANDMALITFLPLGYYVVKDSGNIKYLSFTFIMQNIAANLGGMITPFGNPQNLYLQSHFSIKFIEFIKIMGPYFLLSVILIYLASVLYVEKKPSQIEIKKYKLDISLTIQFAVMFVVFLLIIFDIIPYYYGFIIPLFVVASRKMNVIKLVDFNLLFTFVLFFMFTGNISRVPEVSTFLSGIKDEYIFYLGVISCQLISNVPSAILISKFTINYQALLVAVNVGGVGTLIASLASLITFREYASREPNKKMYYFKMFSLINFCFLISLIFLYYIISIL